MALVFCVLGYSVFIEIFRDLHKMIDFYSKKEKLVERQNDCNIFWQLFVSIIITSLYVYDVYRIDSFMVMVER